MSAARLKDTRAALIANHSLGGRTFGAALTDAVDDALVECFHTLEAPGPVALVALGSYGRRELCPGSDIDVLLVHDFKRRDLGAVRELAERLWYPLWDAGFVTGHGARSVKESIALADGDLDALTALLDVRHVAGDGALTEQLVAKDRELAVRRQARMLTALAEGAEHRRLRPGPVAEMLEPDLKDGAGGLRDVQSLVWAGWALGAPGGADTLVARGYLSPDDLARVRAGQELLLDVRVALHRATSGHADRLVLQEQDAVAALLGIGDADELVHQLAGAARDISWTVNDVWSRVRDTLEGPGGRSAGTDRAIAEGVWLREGRMHVEAGNDGSIPALRALEAAASAAEHDVAFDRASLARLRTVAPPTWDVWARAAFLRLLRAGHRAVPVFEALDHEGALTKLLPEWEHVRSRPQRNAYHRFTVDRHLLEAVAECAELLDAGDSVTEHSNDVDAIVAHACRRPELLLLGALLHDIAKGMPGDHSVVGAETADALARRIGLDSEGREIVVWLVRNHLLMADTATRRDLSDVAVADNLAQQCAADAERLRLLYLLTIGDSRATGPAAWGSSKGSLVRDLFVKTAAAIERGKAAAVVDDRRAVVTEELGADAARALLDRLPDSYVFAFEPDQITSHVELLAAAPPAVRVEVVDGGDVTVTVVAFDQPGLLATLAGALTVSGLDVREANLFGTADGLAFDVFRAADPFGRIGESSAGVERAIVAALAGEGDTAARVAERQQAYSSPVPDVAARPADVMVDNALSTSDTVVEVQADDSIGLLFRLARTLAALSLNVRVAKVATTGERVVDVFYVHHADGGKVVDRDEIGRLRAELAEAASR